jgi:hypothetical protein
MFRTNVVLAILALVLAIPTAWTLYQDRTVFTEYEDIPRLFPGFTRENVRGLVVSIPRRGADGKVETSAEGEVVRDALQMVRGEQDWVVTGQSPMAGVPVRAAQVYERVLQHLESIRRDGDALVQVDARPEDLARYGLRDEDAILLQCFDQSSRPVAELYVGHDASRGQAGEDVVRGFFVRAKDSADVVLYEQTYWVLDVDPAQWYERTPLRFSVEDAVGVRIRNLKGEVGFRRASAADPDWTAVDAPAETGAVRNGEVRAFVQSLSMLSIQEYQARLPDDPGQRGEVLAQRGLADPDFWAEVELADGTRHRIAVGGPVGGRNERHLSISSVDFVMTVGEWIVARFEKDPAAAFFDPAPARAAGSTERDR